MLEGVVGIFGIDFVNLLSIDDLGGSLRLLPDNTLFLLALSSMSLPKLVLVLETISSPHLTLNSFGSLASHTFSSNQL